MSVIVAGLLLSGYGDGSGGVATAAHPGGGQQTTAPFVSVLNGGGVKDSETELVWETSPDPGWHTWGAAPELFGRDSAPFYCAQKRVGGRMGWRLPSVDELASLIEPSIAGPGLSLPAGHPFRQVQTDAPYWSASLVPSDYRTFVVLFGGGDVQLSSLGSTLHVWCVRGPVVAEK